MLEANVCGRKQDCGSGADFTIPFSGFIIPKNLIAFKVEFNSRIILLNPMLKRSIFKTLVNLPNAVLSRSVPVVLFRETDRHMPAIRLLARNVPGGLHWVHFSCRAQRRGHPYVSSGSI
jgi:hypothetical protein